MSQKGHNDKTELEKRHAALTNESIMSVFHKSCVTCKADSQYSCGLKCGTIMSMNCGSIPEAMQYVEDFRSWLWAISKDDNENLHTMSVRDKRNVLLINELFSMQNKNGELSFTIGKNKVDQYCCVALFILNFLFSM